LGGRVQSKKAEEAKYIYQFFNIVTEERTQNEWLRCKEMKKEGEITGSNRTE